MLTETALYELLWPTAFAMLPLPYETARKLDRLKARKTIPNILFLGDAEICSPLAFMFLWSHKIETLSEFRSVLSPAEEIRRHIRMRARLSDESLRAILLKPWQIREPGVRRTVSDSIAIRPKHLRFLVIEDDGGRPSQAFHSHFVGVPVRPDQASLTRYASKAVARYQALLSGAGMSMDPNRLRQLVDDAKADWVQGIRSIVDEVLAGNGATPTSKFEAVAA